MICMFNLVQHYFENFRDKCLEIYKLDPTSFSSAPGQAWQACLKKIDIELELLTDYDMLNMFEKGIRCGSQKLTKTYIDVDDLKIFKNLSKEEKLKFKRRPKAEIETVTTETIKLITAKIITAKKDKKKY